MHTNITISPFNCFWCHSSYYSSASYLPAIRHSSFSFPRFCIRLQKYHRWRRTKNKHRVLWYGRYQSRFNFPASICFCNVHAQLTGVPSDFLWSYDPLAHGLDGRRLNSSYTFREGKVIEKKSALDFIINQRFVFKEKTISEGITVRSPSQWSGENSDSAWSRPRNVRAHA